MPFTASHIVAAVPFDKALGKYSALSALIIGSMTPDITYIVPSLLYQRMDSHSLIGLYLFCIPMGLTVYFLYHLLMAPVLCSLLPKSIKQHLSSDLFIGRLPTIPAHILILSIVLGALTHIIWDFFTHQSGLAQYITWVDTPLIRIDGYDIMPYRLLQHVSSVLGLCLLIYWITKWYRSKQVKVQSKTTSDYWQAPKTLKRITITTLSITSVVSALFYGYMHLPDTDVLYGFYSAQVFVRFAIVGGAAAFLVSCCALGLIYQIRIRKDIQSRST